MYCLCEVPLDPTGYALTVRDYEVHVISLNGGTPLHQRRSALIVRENQYTCTLSVTMSFPMYHCRGKRILNEFYEPIENPLKSILKYDMCSQSIDEWYGHDASCCQFIIDNQLCCPRRNRSRRSGIDGRRRRFNRLEHHRSTLRVLC